MNRLLFHPRARIAAAILVLLIIGAVVAIASLAQGLPSLEAIAGAQVVESTKIYDRTGESVLYELYKGERRTSIPLSEIPAYMQNATIAIEDRDFYSHEAISIRGIVRAALANILNRSIVEGGSTITQQLARTMFLTKERSIIRKLRELVLAFRIERQYDKNTIFELYLNQVPYGGELYGIEAASNAYFKKSARDLTLAESALLASLPKGPSYYSPWGSHVDELLSRKDLVLERMKDLGYITESEAERAAKERLTFAEPQIAIQAPHFVNAVAKQLVAKYGEDFVRTAGLRVITTLDLELQSIAEKAVTDGAKRNEELYQGTNAAFVAEDPKTGEILALVGSRDYFDREHEGNFDIANLGLRQPGSAIKPFAYYTAFTKGFTPDTIVFDVPTDFNATGNPNLSYAPQNFDNKFRGPVTFREGLGQSLNVPSVKVLYLAGVPDTVQSAQKFGLRTLTDPWRYGLSLALGGGEVRLIDLIGAYAVFANDGVKAEQTLIREIRDKNGKILEIASPRESRVADTQAVRLTNDILADTETRSGLFHSSLPLTIFPGYDIALKTGTTNDYRDAWTIGYTPSFVAGVWAGNNDNTPMQSQAGSILAALPIWNQFMREAITKFKPEPFARPGQIATDKPILNGEYIATYELNGQRYRELHDTLFYVDKNDPKGREPGDPYADPQFKLWEDALIEWARVNVPDFATMNQPVPYGARRVGISPRAPEVTLVSPEVGGFVREGSFMTVEGVARAPGEITRIEVFINGVSRAVDVGNFGELYEFNFTIPAESLTPQNLVRVNVKTKLGETAEEETIFYRK